MTLLSRDAPVPLYHQVKTLILREIEAGRWKPDERLPTEDELSSRFAVSKITVRQALRDLSAAGVIRREQGRGTFVQPPPVEQGPRELTSFTDEMRKRGLTAASRVLERGMVPAGIDVAARLALAPGDPVFRLRRLRLADGEPMGLQTAYVPMVLVHGIAAESFAGASLYQVLRDRFNLYPATAHETHVAVLVGAADAALLGVAAGAPAMAAERIAFLADGRPLEYVQSIMRGDRYTIVLDLTKSAAGRTR